MPRHDLGRPRPFAGLVILDLIVLEPVGPTFVASLPGSHLIAPQFALALLQVVSAGPVEIDGQRFHGQPNAVFPGTGLGGANQSGGQVRDAGTGLNLVAILPTRPGARKEGHLEVRGVALSKSIGGLLARDQHGHGHSRAVNPSTSFVSWDALNPMAARLVVEAGHVGAFKKEGQQGVAGFEVRLRAAGMLSADAVGVAQVSVSQFGREQACIRTAFSRPEFDLTSWHDTSP